MHIFEGFNLRKTVGPVFALVFFILAGLLLRELLKHYHIQEMRSAFQAIPGHKILLSLCFTFLSYLVLSFYDTLAFQYIKNPLAYKKIALTSFISYTFANNTGSLSILTSSSIRYRFYSSWGFSTLEITRIIWFCLISFWLGYLFLTGIGFLIATPSHIFSYRVVSPVFMRVCGLLFLLLVVIYLALSAMRKASFRFFKWELSLPPLRLALGQIGVASMDLLSAAGALYVLLPTMDLQFYSFVSLFLLAIMLGLISNVPGGLGVFESIMLLMLTPYAKGAELISALLLFRVIYYLLPLGLALLGIGGFEIYSRRFEIFKVSSAIQKAISVMIPQVFALATMVSGGILLFSGTMPRLYARISWLVDILPLPVLEISHFLGSIAGMGLLILAMGLRRRLDMAYFLTIIFLVFGIISSLLKGLDYDEAIWFTILLVALALNRKQFYRRSSMLAEPIKPGWIGALLISLCGSIGLGLFAYRHQSYTNELWWQFALHGDAPRFMRASVGALAVICFFAFARLFRVYQQPPPAPTREDIDQAALVAAKAPDTNAYLSLLGDKTLLFSPSRKTFIMYGIKGRSWIAMGDPVGDDEEKIELIWEFKNLAEHYNGWPVFYEVGHQDLYRYIDMGMTTLKIGEAGRVNLGEFSLTGSKYKGLRYIHNHLSKEGYQFEVIRPEKVRPILSELRDVSDEWLSDKKAAEKGFSLGFFDDRYLSYFSLAVVRLQDKILAFTNLWQGGGQEELSIDLMRYSNDAPRGIMDFIFCEIMFWAQSQDYKWFSLGMVPLAGLGSEKTASLWGNIGTFVYRHGEHFYNFKGLRSYKDKFNPVWQPKYLVTPGGLQLPVIFANLTALIGGGLKQVITK